MSPHLMASLGGSVAMSAGAIATSYDADDLVDGDPLNPVLTTNGTATFSVTGSSIVGVNGAVIVNHDLTAGINAVLGGSLSGTIVTPPVPPGFVRRNGHLLFTPVTAANATLAITGYPSPFRIGEFIYGKFQEILAMPPESNLEMLPYEVPPGGEYGGLSQSLGARSRRYGGTIYVDDVTAGIINDWYEACDNNSLSSIIIPFPQRDAWCVKWVTYSPKPVTVDLGSMAAWKIDLEWEELPRLRWP